MKHIKTSGCPKGQNRTESGVVLTIHKISFVFILIIRPCPYGLMNGQSSKDSSYKNQG